MIFKETFNMISLLSPYLIPMYLLMSSFFNQDVKALIYLVCLTINALLTGQAAKLLKLDGHESSQNNLCTFGPFSRSLFSQNNTISINSSIIGFTMGYLVVPMFKNQNINYSILAMFLALFSINGFTQYANKCVKGIGIIIGGIVGFLISYIVIMILESDKTLKYLLYFNESVNQTNKCKLIKQKYKCKKMVLTGPVLNDN